MSKVNSRFHEYTKLLRFVKPFRGILWIAAGCMAVSTLFEGVSIGMIIPICDRIFNNKQIIIPGKLPAFIANIVAVLNATSPMQLLKYLIFFMLVLFLVKEIVFYYQNYFMNMLGQSVVRDVRNKLYAKFQDLSMDFYASKRVGELISRITNDVGLITQALSSSLTDMVYQSMRAVFFAVVAFFLAFNISWKLSIFAFIIFPAIMVPVTSIGKRVKKYTKVTQERAADLNSHLAETISGAYIVKAFCREEYEIERFRKINQEYYKFTMKSVKRTIVLPPLIEYVGVAGVAIILWMVGKEVINGHVSFGVFAVFLASLLSLMAPIKRLSNVYTSNLQALVASQRIYSILDEEPKVKDNPDAVELKAFDGGVSFENVSFAYDGKEYVLREINLSIKRGELVALVGHSGAGKSTLVSLIPRLYDPSMGTVRIDGRDIKEYMVHSLREKIAIVSQEMVLFNATVRDNIAYGKTGASDEEVIAAAKKAHAWEFIERLPDGLGTLIGDRGSKLSGGERQRLSIARAILKDSPILILDEATSNLDAKSEQLIKEALSILLKGKTAFVIAHRLSTIQQATRIVAMEKGRIVEVGTHAELLSLGGLYKKLHALQFNA
jgi:subfamily B ATP-binding cassette protein MsbA